jgi:hypothetical protein
MGLTHRQLLVPIGLIVAGVAVIWWPLALIVAGVLLAAWVLYPEEVKQDEA